MKAVILLGEINKGGFMKRMIAFVALMGVLSGCMKMTPSDRVSWRQIRGQNLPSPEVLQGNQPQNPANSRPWGRIWALPEQGQAFNQALKALVSPNLAPTDLGWVDPQTGVRFKGYVPVDAQGYVRAGQGVLEIEIWDEWVGQILQGESVDPVRIRIPAQSGRAWGGRFQVRFQDGYGWIDLTGTYEDGGKMRGELSFQNQNGSWGRGLRFEIDTCQFFTCQ